MKQMSSVVDKYFFKKKCPQHHIILIPQKSLVCI